MTALVGALLAGCGDAPGADSGVPEASPAGSVSEAVPTGDARSESGSDSGHASDGRTVSASALDCPISTETWFQSQPSWNGNPNTAGTYFCSGHLPQGSDGTTYSVTANSLVRTGSARFTCLNGSWLRLSSNCDGRVIPTTSATGLPMTCSSTDPVRSMWISWYLADLKRCADTGGLDWWVNKYNTDTTVCLASTNYDGYGDKDVCWRENFRAGANANGNSYNQAQASGHISSSDESSICGSGRSYPWSFVSTYGTTCKARP